MAKKAPATFTITKRNFRSGRELSHTGTIEELTQCFSYTLDCGKSYEREKGNSKINTKPKNIKSLVDNINKAMDNSAANGAASDFVFIKEPEPIVAELVDGLVGVS